MLEISGTVACMPDRGCVGSMGPNTHVVGDVMGPNTHVVGERYGPEYRRYGRTNPHIMAI